MIRDKTVRNRALVFLYILFTACLIAILVIACNPLESSGYFGPEGQGDALIKSERTGLPALSGIPYYQIDIEIDFDNGTYNGSVEIDYVNLERTGLESLYFRLFPNGGGIYGSGFLEVGSAMVDNEEASTIVSVDDSVMELILPEELSAGERIKIKLDFNGKTSGEAGVDYGIHNSVGDMMTLSGWYPILVVYDDEEWNIDPVTNIGDSVYSDTAYYDVALTIEEDLKVASTGVIIEDKKKQIMEKYNTG